MKDYKAFKEKILVGIDFVEMAIAEIDDYCQDLYSRWKYPTNQKTYQDDLVWFLLEQVGHDCNRDNSELWLSERGMAILQLERTVEKMTTRNPFPTA